MINVQMRQFWSIENEIVVEPVPPKVSPSRYWACIFLDISCGKLTKKGALAIELMKEGVPPSDIFMKLCRERHFGRGGMKRV